MCNLASIIHSSGRSSDWCLIQCLILISVHNTSAAFISLGRLAGRISSVVSGGQWGRGRKSQSCYRPFTGSLGRMVGRSFAYLRLLHCFEYYVLYWCSRELGARYICRLHVRMCSFIGRLSVHVIRVAHFLLTFLHV